MVDLQNIETQSKSTAGELESTPAPHLYLTSRVCLCFCGTLQSICPQAERAGRQGNIPGTGQWMAEHLPDGPGSPQYHS